MASHDLRKYFDKLDERENFIPLLQYFIHSSIAEQYSLVEKMEEGQISYSQFYEKFVNAVFSNNAENVFKYSQSPIERVFLNSFMLLFLRSRMPCLFITHPFSDTEVELSNLRNHYSRVVRFIGSYQEVTGDTELEQFEQRLKVKQTEGTLTAEEVEDVLLYKNVRKVFEFNSYHITPQASFPNLKIDNISVRADLFIWVPNDPEVKIIVECDGFQFHTTRDSFVRDKKRDRLFQLNGYRVLRYSGSEIYQDPVKVSTDLFDLLEVLDADREKLRTL